MYRRFFIFVDSIYQQNVHTNYVNYMYSTLYMCKCVFFCTFLVQSVTTVYTIDQIRQLSEHRHEQEFTKSFVTEGITYALITYLDIDGDPSTCLTHKWYV